MRPISTTGDRTLRWRVKVRGDGQVTLLDQSGNCVNGAVAPTAYGRSSDGHPPSRRPEGLFAFCGTGTKPGAPVDDW